MPNSEFTRQELDELNGVGGGLTDAEIAELNSGVVPTPASVRSGKWGGGGGEAPAMRGLPSTVPNPVVFEQQKQFEADERQNLRTGIGLVLGGAALPALSGIRALSVPGAATLAGSNLAMEGLDKVLATIQGHPEEGPSLTGASVRTALSAGIPAAAEKVIGKFLPALGRGSAGVKKPTIAELPAKVGKEPAVAIGQKLKDTVRSTLKDMSPEWKAKQTLLKQLESTKPDMVDVGPIVEKMRGMIPAGKATGDTAEDAARAYLNKKADELAAEAATTAIDAGVKYNPKNPAMLMPISRANEYIASLGKMGWKESGASLTREAAKSIRKEFLGIEKEFVQRIHGKEALASLDDLNQKIYTRLASAEGVKKFFSKSPMEMVNGVKNNPEMADAVETLDKRLGTDFLRESQAYHDSIVKVNALRESVKSGNKKALSEYRIAVKVAEGARKSAIVKARILSSAFGIAAGSMAGYESGIPYAGWIGGGVGASVGGLLGQHFAKAIVGTVKHGSRAGRVATQASRYGDNP